MTQGVWDFSILPKILFRNPIRNLFHPLPIFLNKRVQVIVNRLLLLTVIADGFLDYSGTLFLPHFKLLHIGLLDTHERQLTLELADIGIVAVNQVAVNVLLAGFTQVAVVLQQLNMLTFFASTVNSIGGVEILSAAIDTAVQLDIAVLDLPSEEINKRLISITLNIYCSVFEKYQNQHLAVVAEYMRSNSLAIA